MGRGRRPDCRLRSRGFVSSCALCRGCCMYIIALLSCSEPDCFCHELVDYLWGRARDMFITCEGKGQTVSRNLYCWGGGGGGCRNVFHTREEQETFLERDKPSSEHRYGQRKTCPPLTKPSSNIVSRCGLPTFWGKRECLVSVGVALLVGNQCFFLLTAMIACKRRSRCSAAFIQRLGETGIAAKHCGCQRSGVGSPSMDSLPLR